LARIQRAGKIFHEGSAYSLAAGDNEQVILHLTPVS